MRFGLTLFIFFFLSCSAVGQGQEMSICIQGGLTLSNWHSKAGTGYYTGNKLVPGYSLGYLVEIPLSKSIMFEVGLDLVQKGNKGKTQYFDGYTFKTYTSKYKISYLTVPALLKLKFIERNGKAFVFTGIYGAIGIYGNQKILENENIISTDKFWLFGGEWGSDDNIKRFDSGVPLGLSVEIKKLVIWTAYEIGLTHILDINSIDKVTNRCLRVALGYRFR